MTIAASRVTVSSTAVQLSPVSDQGGRMIIKNVDSTDSASIGGPGVTGGGGFLLGPGAQIELVLSDYEAVYAIRAAAADVDLTVLSTT